METKDPVLKRFGLRSVSQKLRYDKFVSLYMVNFNANEAYRAISQKGDKTTPASVKRAAYDLVRHPYVSYQVSKKSKELDKKMDKKSMMNRERILDELELILNTAKSSDNLIAALKSLDQLSKVVGAYAPEKSEVEHKGVTINYVKPEDK
mgnify:FL=1